jgi:hypothetical protein
MSEPSPSLEQRASQAEKIMSDPARYKVCLGCASIVVERVTLCPNCHAYRFEADAATVVAQARDLGQREHQSVLKSDLE